MVLAARGTHGIDEGLVVTVLHRLVLGGGLCPVNLHLIDACKGQVVVIIGEGCGYLRPDLGETVVDLLLIGVERIVLQPCLMMGVDDNEQIQPDAIIDHLLHACHPNRVDGHCVIVGDVSVPTHRDADGIEACLLHGLDHGLGGYGVAPAGLPLVAVGLPNVGPCPVGVVPSTSGTLQRVAEVPAGLHRSAPSLCIHLHARRIGLCSSKHRHHRCHHCYQRKVNLGVHKQVIIQNYIFSTRIIAN